MEEYSEPDKPYVIKDVTSAEVYDDMMSPNYNFLTNSESQNSNSQQRPYFVGKEALALSESEEYIVRYPIRFGNLNVS